MLCTSAAFPPRTFCSAPTSTTTSRTPRNSGLMCKDVSVDWPGIVARKTKVVTKLAKGVEFLLKKNKVDMIRGLGKIAGPGKISGHRSQRCDAGNRREKHCPGNGIRSPHAAGPRSGRQNPSHQQGDSEPAGNSEIDGHHRRGRGGRGIRFHLPALWNQGDGSGNAAARGAAGRRGNFRRVGKSR